MRYRDTVEYESKKAAVGGFIRKIGHMAQRRGVCVCVCSRACVGRGAAEGKGGEGAET